MQHIGKYKVIKKLGSGSFGYVYLAEDPSLQLQVAIKVFKIKDAALLNQVTSVTEDTEKVLKQRFFDEAITLRKLSANPNIIELYEFDALKDGTPYYVMPFISQTLEDKIGKDTFSLSALIDIPTSQHPRQLPAILAINYLKQLSQALCTVHEHGLVHRDIKPANLLITQDNLLQLSDFGIAKLPLTEHSQTGVGMGSKNYMSPEQQESGKHVQASSDIYSLGVIAYRMFTGQLPVGRFQDPISYAPDLPKPLNDLIILAISQSASLRPNNGVAFLALLNQALLADTTSNIAASAEKESSDDTQIWTQQNAYQIKTALKPLENKIIELLVNQGEIKTSNFMLLQTLADMADLDDLAMQTFVAHITEQVIQGQSPNPNDATSNPTNSAANAGVNNLAGFILWMKTVNKLLSSQQQFLSAAQVSNLVTAGQNTTGKTAEQLRNLIDSKQQSPTVKKRINTLFYSFIGSLKKRPITLIMLTLLMTTVALYTQHQAEQQQTLHDNYAWIEAKKEHTVDAYTFYMTKNPEGKYYIAAKQALADLLKKKETSNKYKSILSKQQVISVQQQLIKLGYQIGVTGQLDERTLHAIKSFEEKENLLITGKVDELLLQKLIEVYRQKDEQYWLTTKNKNTVRAYQSYKKAFAQGLHVIQATQLIKQLITEKTNNNKHQQQKQEQHRQKVITLATTQLLNNMITLPSGNLMMGCNVKDHCKAKERPQHNVSIKTFSIMATEVTFTHWDACVTSGACSTKPDDESWGRGNRPVIGVSYHAIVEEFIPWLNKATAEQFSLPSEAQWEYAAKASGITAYAWGNELDCLQARFSQFSGLCGNERKTSVVKSFQPNAFGLYDMHGNVWEWTQDCWNDSYDGAPLNATAWQAGDCSAGVIRGGSWLNEKDLLRSTFRQGYSRLAKTNVIGFRLVINSQYR